MAISTFDARDGLSREALQGLRGAHRVALALKDRNTAALGYWIKTQHPDQQDSEEFRLVILHANASLPHGLQISDVQPLIIGVAQDDLLWQEALEHLHPGDMVIVQWAGGPSTAVSLAVVIYVPKRSGPRKVVVSQRRTVPLTEQYLGPGTHLYPSFVPTYFLGHTINQRPRRSGQSTSTWRATLRWKVRPS